MCTISKAPHLILRPPPGVFFSAGPQLSLDATIQSPVKNVASILQRTFRGEKHFFQANEGKVIPFTVVITPLIYSWLNPTKWIFSCFRVVSTSITSTSYKSLSVLRFRSTFSIFFFAKLPHFFHKTPWRTWHSLRSIVHVYLCPNRPLPFHLHLHEISKFLDSET